MAARRTTKRNRRSNSRSVSRSGKTRPKTKSTWGGRRPGAGRPKGSGTGPSPDSRKNRVAVMFSDTELDKLRAVAKKRKIPIATAAYRMIERSLKRA